MAALLAPKPEIPYIRGQQWTVTEHFPPKPPIDRCCGFEPEARKEAWNTDSLTRCVRHPPTSGSYGTQKTSLRIVDGIRVGDGNTAQTVLVKVVSGQYSGMRMVAKFYDPLYYDDGQDDVDPLLTVDMEYSCESTA